MLATDDRWSFLIRLTALLAGSLTLCTGGCKNDEDAGDMGVPDLGMPDPTSPDDLAAPSDLTTPMDLTMLPDLSFPLTNGWQSLQRSYKSASGATCTSRVTLGLGDQSVCYEAANDHMKCAGSIYMTNFGTSFADSGRVGVDQVLISPTFNSATGNGIFTHQIDGTIWSMGDCNAQGQFGNGTKSPSASFVQWGMAAHPLVNFASGTYDQICALDTTGTVYCTGSGQVSYGTTPSMQGSGGGHSSVWVDTFGEFNIDDTGVIRPGEGRAECTVTTAGVLDCRSFTLGTAGKVVMGGELSRQPGTRSPPSRCNDSKLSNLLGAACWLESDQTVYCTYCDSSGATVNKSYFSGQKIISIGLNFYSDNLCAVAIDGSLWCLGTNQYGQLGTGSASAVTTETQVQPAGSVYTACK